MAPLNVLIAAGVLVGAAVAVGAAAPAAPLFAVSGKITGGPDGGWDLAAVDDGGHRLYVARRGSVMAVDLATGKVTGSVIPIKVGHGVLPVPGTTRVVATDGASGKATLFDGVSGQIFAEIPTGKNPDAVAFDPATQTVWVFNPGSGDAAVIDPATAKVVATVPIGGALELGVADGQGRLYVNVEDKNEVVALDTKARAVIARYPLKGCDGPTGIAYSAKARLIVSACGNGVAKLTTPEGADAGSVTIGPHPDGAAFDEKRQLVLIPTGGDGKLAVIRLTPKPEVVETICTQVGARTIAFDQASETAYLPAASYAPAVGTARPQPLPGSFVIVTVAPTVR